MKRSLLFALLGMVFWSTARAEIPLLLEESVVLPPLNVSPTTPWDVQHWMDDSTFGFAVISGDTLLWAERLSDSVQQFLIPDSVFTSQYSQILGGYHQGVWLMRLNTQPSHAFVLIQSLGYTYDDDELWDFYFYSIFDLTANSCVGHFEIPATHSDGFSNTYTEVAVTDVVLWPPPPLASASFLVTVSAHTYSDPPGITSRDEDIGVTYFAHLQTPPLILNSVARGQHGSVFASLTAPQFALSGYHSVVYHSEFGDDSRYDTTWVQSFWPETGATPEHHTYSQGKAMAQEDLNGTRRILYCTQDSIHALDPDDYSVLWQGTAFAGAPWIARLCGSGDERLLMYQTATRRFNVYDASSGAYLYPTSALQYALKYTIRRPGRDTEFVCNSGRVVQIYRSALPSPQALTCYFIPGDNALRLRWEEVAGAATYHVYAAAAADGDYQEIATVSSGTTSYSLSADLSLGFFRVTAGAAQP